jgi:hypothetical protein
VLDFYTRGYAHTPQESAAAIHRVDISSARAFVDLLVSNPAPRSDWPVVAVKSQIKQRRDLFPSLTYMKPLLQIIRNCKKGVDNASEWHRIVTCVQHNGMKSFGIQKDDPPGGTTGRVGYGTGVDEAPVPDAGSTIRAFSSEVDSGSREENASNKDQSVFKRSLPRT